MATKILLVDDHGIMRQGLRRLLEKHTDWHVIGEAGDGHAAVELAAQLSPEVVVMDLSMPNLNGVDATKQILAANAKVKIVCLSAHADPRMTTDMFKAGATAYVHKEAAFEELAVAITTVLDDQVYVSPRIAALLVDGAVKDQAAEPPVRTSAISMREREVLRLIADGKSTKEIAMQLQLSVKTAETHRRNIMAKLKIESVAELTKYAVREGLTTL